MSEEFRTQNAIEFQPGWGAHATITRDESGAFLITGLQVIALSESAKQSGLTVQGLRSLRFNDLITEATKANSETEFSNLSKADQRRVSNNVERWLIDVKSPWKSRGPLGADERQLAKLAVLYVLETHKNPSAPLVTLSNKLGIERKLLAKRIDRARQLEILTRASSRVETNFGKAVGALTEKGMNILRHEEDK